MAGSSGEIWCDTKTWRGNHLLAMSLSDAARVAYNVGYKGLAHDLYKQAAYFETLALRWLDPTKKRTAKITEDSLIALSEKAAKCAPSKEGAP